MEAAGWLRGKRVIFTPVRNQVREGLGGGTCSGKPCVVIRKTLSGFPHYNTLGKGGVAPRCIPFKEGSRLPAPTLAEVRRWKSPRPNRDRHLGEDARASRTRAHALSASAAPKPSMPPSWTVPRKTGLISAPICASAAPVARARVRGGIRPRR